MDLETVFHFPTPNHRKSQNCAQNGSQEVSKSTLKSIKTDIWATVCPLGVPLDLRIIKMVSQVLKRSLKVSKMTNLHVKSDPLQQSTCQRLLPARGKMDFVWWYVVFDGYIYQYIQIRRTRPISEIGCIRWLYTYIYIRRPPLGGHQAAKRMLQTACPKSFQSFQSQVDSQVSSHFQSSSLQLTVCQSGISF